MARLTEKTENGFAPKYERETQTNYYDLVSKLGELEDIEEELGIDLITLFKAMKEGFYSTYFNDYVKPSSIVWFPHMKPFMEIKVNGLERLIFLKDYGKTWALTKEELECHDM